MASLAVAAVDGQLRAVFLLGEQLRENSAAVVGRLASAGFRVHLLTGDRSSAARELAEQLGIPREQVWAEESPLGKLRVVRRLRDEGSGGVAMVGDGVNDLAALAEADVGVAVAAPDVAAAASAARVVLTGEDFGQVEYYLSLCRRARAVIWQNLAWALAYNVVALPLAAGAFLAPYGVALTPSMSGAFMASSSLLVMANA